MNTLFVFPHPEYPLSTLWAAGFFAWMFFSIFLYLLPIFILSWRTLCSFVKGWFRWFFLIGTSFFSLVFGCTAFLFTFVFLPVVIVIGMGIIVVIIIILSFSIKKDEILSVREDRVFSGVGIGTKWLPAVKVKLKNKFLEKLLFHWPKTMLLFMGGILLIGGLLLLIFDH